MLTLVTHLMHHAWRYVVDSHYDTGAWALPLRTKG
jgi:hypothetical protein